MARKNISRILSGGAIIICTFLFCIISTAGGSFQGQVITFTISGSVGISGVEMKGLPGNPVTDASGYYRATVDYGWTGTVRPNKQGYIFEPASKNYTKVAGNQANEDYLWKLITFTISGTTGQGGVILEGLPGNPVSDINGNYKTTVDYGFSGTVTPTKEGYDFTPPNKIYTRVNRDQTNQNYAAQRTKFTISGSAGVAGVAMNGLLGNPLTGGDGTYTATVEYGWSGTVVPVKEGFTFSPPERQYFDLARAETYQNYTAEQITFTISGTAGEAGVEMKGLPGNPITNFDGSYVAIVNYGFSGTVKPTKEGYTFNPPSMTYSKVTNNRDSQDYSAEPITFTISGRAGQEGVVMNGLPGNPVTGTGGIYTTNVEYGWSGTVKPEKQGYSFTPEMKAYPTVLKSQTNQDYTAELIKYTISGSTGTGDVTMKGLPGDPVSNRDGTYRIRTPYGFSGVVTPTKEGYTFDPPNRQYFNLIGPEADQNYTATILTQTISGSVISDKGPVEGAVILTGIGGDYTETNASGQYEFLVDYGWRGTLSIAKEGYTFNPPSKTYGSPVTRDQMNQDFSAKIVMFTISDSVIIGGTPVEGVRISANNGGSSDITDAKGNYNIKVPYGWSGEITPTKEGFIFNPPSKSYTNVTGNIRENAPEPQRPPQQPTQPQQVPPEPVDATPGGIVTTTTTAGDQTEEAIFGQGPMTTPPRQPQEPVVQRTPEPQDEFVTRVPSQRPDLRRPPRALHEPLISNIYVDTDIREVLQDLATQAETVIIPDESIEGFVTCELNEVPLDTALEIILAGSDYVVQKTPYYYLVCSAGLEDPAFAAVSETRRIKLNYIDSETAIGLLSTAFQPYVQIEPGGRTLSVTASSNLMNRIISDLTQMDQFPRHVMLDARIVVMERGDLLNLGIEWSWPNISAGIFGSDFYGGRYNDDDFRGDWPWGVQIGYTPGASFTNSLDLALNLLSENSEAKIVASPQVLAQDGKETQLKVVQEEYFMMTAPEVYGYSRSELEKIESGTSLTITPRIGDNNDITLDMSVELSDSIPRGRGSDLPVVTRRTSKNTVRIKDGGTVVVAGLTETRKRLTDKKTPGLSNLPLVGGLFNYTDKDEATREIAVFVTARLIPNTNQLNALPRQTAAPYQAPMSYQTPATYQYPTPYQAPEPYQIPTSTQSQYPALQQRPVGDEFKNELMRSMSRNRR